MNLFDTTFGVKHKMESETQSENRYKILDILWGLEAMEKNRRQACVFQVAKK
jgi:hypothetical protein